MELLLGAAARSHIVDQAVPEVEACASQFISALSRLHARVVAAGSDSSLSWDKASPVVRVCVFIFCVCVCRR